MSDALDELVSKFRDEAEDNFSTAYEMGFGAPLTDLGRSVVDGELVRNEGYLRYSIAPDISGRLDNLDDWVEDAILAAFLAFEFRAELYGQPHWSLIWKGFGERKRVQWTETGMDASVTWVLDPTVLNHCHDCPVYAKMYPSFGEMIAVTGGVPGESNAECGPGCRCGLV